MTRIICVFLLLLFPFPSFAFQTVFADRFDCAEAVLNGVADIYQPVDRSQAGNHAIGREIRLEVTSHEVCVRMQVARSVATAPDQTAWVYLPQGSRIRTNGVQFWDDRCGNFIKEIHYVILPAREASTRFADTEPDAEYIDIKPEREPAVVLPDRRPINIQVTNYQPYQPPQPQPQPVYYEGRQRNSGWGYVGATLVGGVIGYLIGNHNRRDDRLWQNNYYGNCSFSQNCGNHYGYGGGYHGGYRPRYPRPTYPPYNPYPHQPSSPTYTPPPNPIWNPSVPIYTGPTYPSAGPGNPTFPPIYTQPPDPGR